MRTGPYGRSAAVASALLAVCCVGVPSASAGVGPVSIPSGLGVAHATSSSFTVVIRHVHNATKYRVFASTTRGDLALSKIWSKAHRSHLTKSRHITLRGLRYTTSSYFYRVEAVNSKHRRFSKEIRRVGLAPAVPSHMVASSSPTGTVLNWKDSGASGYRITQGSDSSLTQGVTNYTIVGSATQFSPPDITPGTTYYFAVRAMNATTFSERSNVAGTTVESTSQPVKVMTYNVLEATQDGKTEGNGVISPWAERESRAVALIKRADPDVIAIQEAAAWADQATKQRQVDSLVAALGGTYALATTETPPDQPHYFRTGDYILYKTSEYTPSGSGGHWMLGDERSAAYQILSNSASGAKFLVVSPHLSVRKGSVFDTDRRRETQALLHDISTLNTDKLPVVVAGDFNSPTDGPSLVKNTPASLLQTAGWQCAANLALTRANAKYNSVNQYYRTPPTHSLHVDDIVTTPGVQVRSWAEVLDLHDDKFVGPIPSDHNPVVADLAIPYQ